MIEFHHVTKKYGEDSALEDISVKIGQGEMVVLLGASGSGKSTFLKMISFEERPTSGEVVVGAHRSGSARASQVRELRRSLGIIYQDFKLLADRSVFENVALPLRVAGMTGRELHHRVEEALERVGMARYGPKHPQQLSGGQQQRVGVARALVHSPTIVLADEPTGNLDPEVSSQVVTIFRAIRSSGTIIILATYDLTLIDPADRVLRLERGRLTGGA
jgi:cell division transport system ATP-binding protein